MPSDISAEVIANTRLSDDYNVLALAAPAIAAEAAPGQFVMVKPSTSHDPLLRRPFSVVDPPIDAWMVAGGVGLAPFAALAEALLRRGVNATLFYGARSAA